MDIRLIGGDLAIDFVNTVDPRVGGGEPREFLNAPEALVDWARTAGLVAGRKRFSVSSRGFRRSIAVREALYRVLVALARGRAPKDEDLERLSREHARAVERARFVIDDSGAYQLDAGRAGDENAVLFPVLASALDLLASPARLARLKECPWHDCGWLFEDTSRSGTRRWCRMASCGARAKMQRYRAKAHQT